MKKKVCKKCKAIVDEAGCPSKDAECPVEKNNQYATIFKGRIHVIDAEHSEIAKKVGIGNAGEYAIKVG